MRNWFSRFALITAVASGSYAAFSLAVGLVIGWACAGPYFHWSDSHSLFINTVTTVITFLQVFLIQHAQTRDAKAVQAKLDELLRGVDKADERLVGIEHDVDKS